MGERKIGPLQQNIGQLMVPIVPSVPAILPYLFSYIRWDFPFSKQFQKIHLDKSRFV